MPEHTASHTTLICVHTGTRAPAQGRGWNAGSASIYALGALVLRRRQEQEEEEEEAQWRAQQAQPPWPPQPLQPWRVAQVCAGRVL